MLRKNYLFSRYSAIIVPEIVPKSFRTFDKLTPVLVSLKIVPLPPILVRLPSTTAPLPPTPELLSLLMVLIPYNL